MANNFIQFNSNKNNMMDDTTYAKQAPLGIVGGGVQRLTLNSTINYSIKHLVL